MSNNILAPVDAVRLNRQGLTQPAELHGFTRLHKRRLNRSSDEEYSELPLTGLGGTSDAYVTVPRKLISLPTLLYLGLAEEVAQALWQEWETWPATGPQRELLSDEDDEDDGPSISSSNRLAGGLLVPFLDFVLGRVLPSTAPDADFEHEDDEWNSCLDAYGLNEETKKAIMDPNFRCIRIADTCKNWTKDTIEMRWLGLNEIQKTSRLRLHDTDDTAGTPVDSHSSRGGPRRHGSGPSRPVPNATASNTRQDKRRRLQSHSEIQRESEPGISTRRWHKRSSRDATEPPGYLVLYKGIAQSRMAGFWAVDEDADDEDSHATGQHRVEKLLSSPPTNFSGTSSLFYFAPDPNVAEYYAGYAKRRHDAETILIVTMKIKRDVLERLEGSGSDSNDSSTTAGRVVRLYYPSPQWKQLVWRSKTVRPFPKPLRKYRDALLIIGSASKGTERVFNAMASWEEIGNECIFHVPEDNPNPAIQYVFNGNDSGADFLRDNGIFDAFAVADDILRAVGVQAE
ncbi:uncharacterized protein SPSK_02453 [Sporothrix schenckii 1099-18]|uniref:Uncharacterized protein n=1 Tax=Sporothrix schenckii 1099-18 TaxID=1397361 RepID=A0A0F2MDR2_SPOSC|nr:uncharacterized protein SPSK_02453 [Sporothrix schenckii 1099-18]KJR86286.1 hypothetical protein SPSK_02453 [Sporothrix schenckii 1099-18]